MINITINAGNISANLQNFSANELPNLIANGLEKVGSLITTESQSICPVDTGRLRIVCVIKRTLTAWLLVQM